VASCRFRSPYPWIVDGPENVKVKCATPDCGAELDERSDLPIQARRPCPGCGGRGRRFDVAVVCEVDSTSSVEYEGRQDGMSRRKGWFVRGSTGSEWSTGFGRWVHKVSVFDRRSNRRLETVTDPETGETLCHQDHPLSEHHGHGSAKQRPNPFQ
jgi:hypothetical protein